MAFLGVAVITQTSDITSFVITDASNYGSEPTNTFSGRTIGIYKIDGTLLVPLISWPFLSGNNYTLTGVLLRDLSLSVVVNWISLAPQPGSTYTVTEVTTFLNYLKQFRYELVQDLTAQPTLKNDTNWTDGVKQLQNCIKGATSATDYADQFAAQSQIDEGYLLKNNQTRYF